MTFHPLRLIAVGALVAPAATILASGSAHAAAETCAGKPATLVISSAPPGGATVQGTPGDDVIVVTYTGQVRVDAGDGNDTACSGPASSLLGGAGDDDLWSGGNMDGGVGDDTLHGDDGSQSLTGGEGNDTLLAGAGDDDVAGNDFGEPTDVVTPRDDDVVDGGPGDDLVQESWGDDTFTGGAGEDTFVIGTSPEDLPDSNCPKPHAKPVLDARAGTVSGLGHDTIAAFEAYRGGPYHQTMLGTAAAETFDSSECGTLAVRGRGGSDVITGDSAGGGTLRGGSGEDQISFGFRYEVRAGAGDDRVEVSANGYDETATYHSQLHGGAGVDTVENHTTDYDRIDLTLGLSSLGQLVLPLRGFENAGSTSGSVAGPIVLVGSDGPNVLAAPHEFPGEPQRTLLRGRRGNDQLLAGAHDTAYGGRGRHDVCRARQRFGCEAR